MTSHSTRTNASSFLQNRWLLWKELRQLAPLVYAMTAIAIALVVGHLFASQHFTWLKNRLELPLLVIPGLFATGAGALMVGHEREQGTMRWLSVLPIDPKTLVKQKFAMAVAGLLVMWLITCSLIWVTTFTTPTGDRWWQKAGMQLATDNWSSISYPGLIAYTFMVLAAGFYSSWLIKNQFKSLLLLVALAVLPMLSSELCNWVGSRVLPPSILGRLWLAFSVIFAITFVILGFREGLRVLSPRHAPQVLPTDTQAVKSPYASPKVTGSTPTFSTQIGPIMWQMWRSSGLILLGLFAVLIVSAILLTGKTLIPNVLFFIGLFAVSWLAVLVFKDDAGHQRVRFFADRGVSAKSVYWGRHLVCISLCALAGLISIGAYFLSSNSDVSVSPFTFLLVVACIYSLSQWVSQLFRMVSVAVIVAPVFVVLVIGWLMICVLDFDAPLWIVIVMMLTPMLITRVMMSRYMDGRDRPWSFVAGAFMLAAFLIIPVLPAVGTVMSADQMTASRRQALLAEVAQVPSAEYYQEDFDYLSAYSWLQYFSPPDAFEDAGMPSDELQNNQPKEISKLKPSHRYQNLSTLDTDNALTVASGSSIYEDFGLQRILAERAAKNDAEQAMDHFRPWLLAVAHAIRGLRKSDILRDQEYADRLEIELLDTMKSELMQSVKDKPVFADIARCLPSIEQRSKSRRRAILVAWKRWHDQQGSDVSNKHDRMGQPFKFPKERFAGYTFSRLYNHHAPRIADALQPAYIDQLVELLLQAAAAPDQDDRWTRLLHQHIAGDREFELGAYGPRFRNIPAINWTQTYRADPCSFWGMSWEPEIEQFRASTGVATKVEGNDE